MDRRAHTLGRLDFRLDLHAPALVGLKHAYAVCRQGCCSAGGMDKYLLNLDWALCWQVTVGPDKYASSSEEFLRICILR